MIYDLSSESTSCIFESVKELFKGKSNQKQWLHAGQEIIEKVLAFIIHKLIRLQKLTLRKSLTIGAVRMLSSCLSQFAKAVSWNVAT